MCWAQSSKSHKVFTPGFLNYIIVLKLAIMAIDFNFVIGILISGLLLVNLKKENRHTIFLCLFFLGISLLSLSRYSSFYHENIWVIYYLIPGANPIITTSGIFLYFYCKYSIGNYSMRNFWKREWKHFVFPAFCFINVMPHLFLPFEERWRIANLIAKDPYNVLLIKTLLIPFSGSLLMRAFLGVVYSFLSFQFIQSNKDRFIDPVHSVHIPSINFYYIINGGVFFHFLTTFWFAMASKFFTHNPFEIYNIKALMVMPTVSLSVVVGSVFFFPKVIYGLMYKRKPSKTDLSEARMPLGDAIIELPNRFTNFDFEPVNGNTVIAEKLKIYFSTKPFLKPGFTLSVITKETNIPYHQLTNYFNNYLGINFNDWKNNARIEFALDLLNNGRAKNLTLESIGYSCGFLSRSNFVNSFRKKVGMTPSEYLRTLPRDKEFVFALDF
ncbi:AraC family transcriptional regulator [Sandaracinomonas limnophila]|uniref:AraC family transcriptional regulator n=1 Tax=Sandaracinomonas limnophila TaxID=1862386 RepID=A0A437PMB7_9BACT|nr:AraC family transcriptional regulator [Sandaracinomonas limnophila]